MDSKKTVLLFKSIGISLILIISVATDLFSQESPDRERTLVKPSKEQPVFSKADSTEIADSFKDEIELYEPRVVSPKKASLYALCVPGLGQIYNRKYWKLPLVYGGFAGCVYGYTWNASSFKDYKEAAIIMEKGYENLTDEDLQTLENLISTPNVDFSDSDTYELAQTNFNSGMEYYRRNRDLSLIAMGLLHLLAVIDASVDAHLSDFDISDNLTLQVTPHAMPSNVGLSVDIRF